MQNVINDKYVIDKHKVQGSFNAAAHNYDAFSLLQQTITDRLLESLEHIKINPTTILDLGAGTGYGTRRLKKYFGKAQVYQLDLSVEMLKQSRKQLPLFFSRSHFLAADANSLPLVSSHFDLVFSSVMLQWCNNLDAVFAEIKRVLKPNGLFIFSSFGPDTLRELRECWRQVDDQVHVNAFVDMHDLGDSLMRNGLDSPVLNTEHIVLIYDECKQLMRELKKIGAHNVNSGRRKTLTGKQRMKKVIKNYEIFRHEGKLPATYEVVYGHAWRPDHGLRQGKHSGTHSISLSELERELKDRKPG